jgi:hypothetical protein
MSQANQQVFRSVVVRSSEIEDETLREQIDGRMMSYEQELMEESSAQLDVERATAKLLRARASRMESRAAVQESFGKGDSRVAMEPNPWEPFRDNRGGVCIENFLSQRDQRNMMRAQKANMNRQVEQMTEGNHGDMFEHGNNES